MCQTNLSKVYTLTKLNTILYNHEHVHVQENIQATCTTNTVY